MATKELECVGIGRRPGPLAIDAGVIWSGMSRRSLKIRRTRSWLKIRRRSEKALKKMQWSDIVERDESEDISGKLIEALEEIPQEANIVDEDHVEQETTHDEAHDEAHDKAIVEAFERLRRRR
uniref:YG6 n=1 Tax=Anopheles gambiae TaxID=7165 RepID=A0A145PY18_ANOGA|nr:YG6 [Anopheles gambiae]